MSILGELRGLGTDILEDSKTILPKLSGMNLRTASVVKSVLGHPKALMAAGASVGAMAGLGMGGMGVTHMIRHNTDPKRTPVVDALMEGVIGDPQADRKLLGYDMRLRNLMPGFWSDPKPLQIMHGINSMALNYEVGVNQNDQKYIQQVAKQNIGQGYATYPYPNTTMPYRPSASRSLNASGDIVLGLYNAR